MIQNLDGSRVENEYLYAICILKNILQRGKPTLMSSYLQEQLGSLHKDDNFNKGYPLIGKEPLVWDRIIRGDEKGNYFPAKKFIDDLIPKYLEDYSFIQQLIIPEVAINEITQTHVDEFENQQVDFYLPQAYLVIEIDGSQHNNSKEDKERDKHLKKFGILTIRIKTQDLESENETFFTKIDLIKERLSGVISSQSNRKIEDKEFISLDDYSKVIKEDTDYERPVYKATAVLRFQIIVLELLEQGKLEFSHSWGFKIHSRDIKGFAEIALKDLFIWFKHIYKLQKLEFATPKVEVKYVDSFKQSSNNSKDVLIDFSLMQRYTDEFQLHPDIIFCRTDYFDEYRYFKKGDSNRNLTFASIEAIDYFKVSTYKPFKYNIVLGGKESDEPTLLFLLWNIFLQNYPNIKYESLKFREGQLPIISNALSLNDTIGLLPTGSGKSVCYQLSAILQPAVSFVVCPIKSLMYDQKADLNNAYVDRVAEITSDLDGEDKDRIQRRFGDGKYFFIFISPERFQLKTFREYFSKVSKSNSIAYAVIDEVHCLSEWGHDFRTSYLNLSNAIKRLANEFVWIGLTATASINVLKNIQIEFGIKQSNVKTPLDYTRKELEFHVIDDGNSKLNELNSKLVELKEHNGALVSNGDDTKSGLIFTPTVNGNLGCYPLYLELAKKYNGEVRFFSGSKPKVDDTEMSDSQFNELKKQNQNDFKNNKYSLLVATKAFGMGVNKGNVHYTFHYGIPSSMESLYQEAGRAGRNKARFKNEKAKCFVLLSKSNNQEILNKIWERDTNLSEVNKLQKKTSGDINTNLFLFSVGQDAIRNEFEIIKKLFEMYANASTKNVKVEGKGIGENKARTEKGIYRLRQLGVIEDWTISNFFGGGRFEVDFTNFNESTIQESLIETIKEYDKEFSLPAVHNNPKYINYKKILDHQSTYSSSDKYILILLQWAYQNFAYNRKQSLKNIYENCSKFADGTINGDEFKLTIENYFKFNETSYILQHIAENPKDFKKWFEVFYQIEGNTKTHKFIESRDQESIRDNLSRFLESYMHNVGLDFISGFVRLILDEYDNSDGQTRFESSLKQISTSEEYDVGYIIDQTIKIGTLLSSTNKTHLAMSLDKYFHSQELLFKLSHELEDEYSMALLIDEANNRLKNINSKIYGGFKETT